MLCERAKLVSTEMAMQSRSESSHDGLEADRSSEHAGIACPGLPPGTMTFCDTLAHALLVVW